MPSALIPRFAFLFSSSRGAPAQFALLIVFRPKPTTVVGEVPAATATEQLQFLKAGVVKASFDCRALSPLPMKTHLLIAASQIIPDKNLLVNVISRRVRQLSFGHRPLVACLPGTGFADVALTEVIEKKLTYESTLVPKEIEQSATVVPFPKVRLRAKAA